MDENEKIKQLSKETGVPIEMLTEEWNNLVQDSRNFDEFARIIRAWNDAFKTIKTAFLEQK
jgi:hypothetical protein